MSDGDHNATPAAPGRPGASGTAPWERWQTPSHFAVTPGHWPAEPPTTPTEERTGEATGCHTDGELTVAELIAKIGGATRPSHHHSVPDIEPGNRVPTESDHAEDSPDTDAIPIASAYAAELPDLGRAHHRVPTRAAPTRIGRVPAAGSSVAGSSAAGFPAAKPKSGHRPMLLAGRSVAALIAVLSLALTGGAWQWSTSKNNRLNFISALDPHSRDIVDPNGQYGDENFLIVGVDSRAGENSDMGAGDTEDAGGARSDTVMLVNIPANRKRVVAVSFPRDLAITPMRCEAWNPGTGAYGPIYDAETETHGSDMVYTETKLNSAYAFGGPKCLVKVLQKLSGLSINRFMAIDFAGFAKMVDALGGVEVCSTTALEDYELGTVLSHAGHQVIDGSTALNYVRARNVTTEVNGDYGRIKRQQLFLSSLLRSLISSDTFFSLSKLNNVVNMFISDSYVDNVKTKDLVGLGQSLQGVSAGHITFVTVPTGETDQDGNEPPRTTDMRALFDAIINDDPLPGETDRNAQPSTSAPTTELSTSKAPERSTTSENQSGAAVQAVTTAPQDVTVQVSNSTGTSGLAATATDELEQHGFNVMDPDDYPGSLKSTTVFFSPGNEQAAATVASAFAGSQIERVTGMGQVVQVVLGPDFRSVVAPPPSGSSVSVHITRDTNGAPTKLPEDLTVTNAADTSCE